MEFNSIEEVLDYAIEQEVGAQEFYRSLAEQEKISGRREMFADFVEEEKKHEQVLLDIKNGKVDVSAAGDYKFEWIEDIKRGDTVETPEYYPSMPYNEVLLIAIKREEKALKMYRGMYQQARTRAERDVFKMLRQEEAKHKLALETMLDDFMYEMGD